MGPTSPPPLPARGTAGKALAELTGRHCALDPPGWRNGCARLKDEEAPCDLLVRDRQPPRTEAAAAPEDGIEIEHARSPAPPPSPAEVLLNALQAPKHIGGLEIAFDQRDRVREVASGAAVRGVEDDRRRIEQAKVLVERGD